MVHLGAWVRTTRYKLPLRRCGQAFGHRHEVLESRYQFFLGSHSPLCWRSVSEGALVDASLSAFLAVLVVVPWIPDRFLPADQTMTFFRHQVQSQVQIRIEIWPNGQRVQP